MWSKFSGSSASDIKDAIFEKYGERVLPADWRRKVDESLERSLVQHLLVKVRATGFYKVGEAAKKPAEAQGRAQGQDGARARDVRSLCSPVSTTTTTAGVFQHHLH